MHTACCLKVQVVSPSTPPLLPTSRTHPIRILPGAHTHTAPTSRPARFNILIRELPLELRLEAGDRADERGARLLEDGGGGDGTVGLDLDDEMRVEGMGDFVPCKKDLGHG